MLLSVRGGASSHSQLWIVAVLTTQFSQVIGLNCCTALGFLSSPRLTASNSEKVAFVEDIGKAGMRTSTPAR